MDITWIVLSWIFAGLFFAARTIWNPTADDKSLLSEALDGDDLGAFFVFLIFIFFSPVVAALRILIGLTKKY